MQIIKLDDITIYAWTPALVKKGYKVVDNGCSSLQTLHEIIFCCPLAPARHLFCLSALGSHLSMFSWNT